MSTAFVPKETAPGETRVALVADGVKRLAATGLSIQVEAGAGASARVSDADYEKAGAKIVAADAWATADLVLKVQPPSVERSRAPARAAPSLVSLHLPAREPCRSSKRSPQRGVSALAMELVPRITRAQSMDVLSLAGDRRRLQGRAARRRALAAHVPDADDRRRHHRAGARPRPRRRRRRAAGDRDRAPPRRASSRRSTSATPRRSRSRASARRFVEVPALADLEGAGGYAKEASAEDHAKQREAVGEARRRGRRRHHDRAHPGQAGADARHRGRWCAR